MYVRAILQQQRGLYFLVTTLVAYSQFHTLYNLWADGWPRDMVMVNMAAAWPIGLARMPGICDSGGGRSAAFGTMTALSHACPDIITKCC
jgi:hypothetical protein